MPSITVCRWASVRSNSRTSPCSATATGCVGCPAKIERNFAPPPCELGVGHVGVADLVDDVVHFAAERVERRDGAPPRRRQEHEAVVEAGPAGRCLLLAVLVGRHAAAAFAGTTARHATTIQSRVASTGRRAKTSPSTAVDAVEDPQSAADDRRQFQTEAPREHAREGAAGFEQAAARARLQNRAANATRRRRGRRRSAARSRQSDVGRPAAGRRDSFASRSAMSCQKLVSCKPVQMASLASRLDGDRAS